MFRTRASLILLAFGSLAVGCEADLPTNPFTPEGGGGTGGAGGSGGSTVDPELGGPCVEDAQCDDGIDCTEDSCDDELDRCRFHPVDATCDNGVECDGAEVCAQTLGCVAGPPKSCDDANVCTIDRCDEPTGSCEHTLRDADGDGDVDIHCGGGDCNDVDPEVSSLEEEVCDNDVDDDCDTTIDEAACATPMNDTCADPVVVTGSGSFALSTFGASAQYPTTCTPPGAANDVVMAIVLPDGEPLDVRLAARTATAQVSTALAAECGNAATEIACGPTYATPSGDNVSKLRVRSLAGGTTYPVYVTTILGDAVAVDVELLPATSAPTNETCGTAAPLTLGVPFEVEIVDATEDQVTECASVTGELVYELVLDQPSDVQVFGNSMDDDGFVSLSLLGGTCADPSDEIACHTGATASLYRHSLPAGTYYLAVSATAPTRASVNVTLSAPTPAPLIDTCETAPDAVPLVANSIDYGTLQDDHKLSCFQNAPDAAFALAVDEPTDFLFVNRLAGGDSAAMSFGGLACDEAAEVACAAGGNNPLRLRRRNVQPGEYRVITESLQAFPQELTVHARSHAPTQLVPFSDDCTDVLTIPSGGGFFQGNTSNVSADFSAGCDADGQPPNGAKDQLLKLVLAAPKRVVLDMSGSGYDTMLSVRQGTTCPGVEVPLSCTAAIGGIASFRDLELPAGTYFIQIDGLASDFGPWSLDVFVEDL